MVKRILKNQRRYREYNVIVVVIARHGYSSRVRFIKSGVCLGVVIDSI